MSAELAGFHIEGLEDGSRVDGTRESSRQRLSNREREGMPDHLTTEEEKGIIAGFARVDTSTSHPRGKARYQDGVDGPNKWGALR